MALKHHVGFRVPGRTVAEKDVIDHFLRLGYALVDEAPGEWTFRRGTKLAALWRFDIRAYATELVVRAEGLRDGSSSWVSCDFEVWTFLTLITSGDVATLEAEARELESILWRHAEPEAAPRREGSTAFRGGPPLPPPEASGKRDSRGIRAEPGTAADRPRD
jgi:hypothetical protein